MLRINKASLALLLSTIPTKLTISAVLPATPIVSTSLGKIRGVATDGVDAFLGIQYAKVGERFTRSKLLDESWEVSPFRSEGSGTLDATEYGPICWQDPYLLGFGPLWDPANMDEECLYLNVWRPSNAQQPLSTMVWIHGGAFIGGSGSDIWYNGAKLARKGGVIVVSINYRLGPFGFLAKDEQGTGGMNGIEDQINALKWINKHIGSFGGKENDVTIFGESAGSMSAALLSVSPLAKGLFQRAILQSGAIIAGWTPMDRKDALELATNTLEYYGAQTIQDLADRTRFPAKTTYAWDPQLMTQLFAGWPDQKAPLTIDDFVIPDWPYKLFTNSASTASINAKDMIIGSTSYDGLFPFFPTDMWEAMIAYTPSMLEKKIGEENANTISDAYSPDDHPFNGSPHAAFIQMDGDYQVRCPSRELAVIAARGVSGKVFLFNFAHHWDGDPAYVVDSQLVINDPKWASHMSDVFFVFGSAGLDGTTIEKPEDLALSEEMMRRWASFAKTGNPNIREELPEWSPVPDNMALFSHEAAEVPSMLFQGGGSEMIPPETKTDQCSLFLPAYNFSDIPEVLIAQKETSNTNFVSGTEGLMMWSCLALAAAFLL